MSQLRLCDLSKDPTFNPNATVSGTNGYSELLRP